MHFLRNFTTMSKLTEDLKSSKILKTQNVINVFGKVDRKYFTDYDPYFDSPAPIGYGATISAPHIHAHSLELLAEKLEMENSKVLDVGCGSGYLTLCMSLMNNSTGTVVGIEHIPQLVLYSSSNIKRAGYKNLLDENKIIIVEGDGRKGYKQEAPYDVIHVGAAAPTIPENLIEQLKDDGIMLMPVGEGFEQELRLIRKRKDGILDTRKIWDVRFVPLTDKNKQI